MAGCGGRHEVEHLAVGEESFLECAVIDGLHGGIAFDGEAGGGGGRLTHDHEDGLHADRAVGDVARAQADRHEQVGAFGGARADAPVADGVGFAADLDVALVAHETFLGHEALDVVRVHLVGAHADGVLDDFDAAAVLLGHHVVGDHAAGFADVELAGPVAVILEFIFREAELLEGQAHLLGHTRVISVGPHQALLPVFMGLPDLGAGGVIGVGVIPVLADEVGADREVVVRIRLAVGHPYRIPGDAVFAGLDVAEGEFVPAFVVIGRLLPVAAVLRDVRRAHAEIIGLHLSVAGAVGAGDFLFDAR